MELKPEDYHYGRNVAWVDGVLSWIGEGPAGRKYQESFWMEQGLHDTTFSLAANLWLGSTSVRAGVRALLAARGPAVALTEHGAARAVLRGISEADIKSAMRNATQVIIKMGKYGTPQKHYIGANGITVIVEQGGRNADKIVTAFRTGVR